MIRGFVLLAALMAVYFTLTAVVRSAIKGYRADDRRRGKRTMGEDMVLDPECRTYVVKDRSIERNIGGARVHFCSDACAERYEEKNRT